jgi:hypothetical protein
VDAGVGHAAILTSGEHAFGRNPAFGCDNSLLGRGTLAFDDFRSAKRLAHLNLPAN